MEMTINGSRRASAPAPAIPSDTTEVGHDFARGRALLLLTALLAVLWGAGVLAVIILRIHRLDWVEVAVFGLLLIIPAVVAARLYDWARGLQQRLALVECIAAAGDARFGAEAVVRRLLRCLRDHYQAKTCVFVLSQQHREPRLFRLDAGAGEAREVTDGADDLLPRLLALEMGSGIACQAPRSDRWWRRKTDRCRIHDPAHRRATPADREAARGIAAMLDCSAFVAIPLSREIRVGGRLFIGDNRHRYGPREVAFLRQLMEQVTLLLENTSLLDMLVAETVGNERQRIARDLHDSAIQPYIGLKFGLEALARKLRDNPNLLREARRLVEQVSREIIDMRQLCGGLSGTGSAHQTSLMSSLRRQSARYCELFGISVEVGARGEALVSRSLAHEILNMVSEGLSNVCRHTTASRATVDLRGHDGSLELQIVNDRGLGSPPPPPFVPRSLSERAAALGGSVAVEVGADGGCTAVIIRIPLE